MNGPRDLWSDVIIVFAFINIAMYHFVTLWAENSEFQSLLSIKLENVLFSCSSCIFYLGSLRLVTAKIWISICFLNRDRCRWWQDFRSRFWVFGDFREDVKFYFILICRFGFRIVFRETCFDNATWEHIRNSTKTGFLNQVEIINDLKINHVDLKAVRVPRELVIIRQLND